MHRERVARHYLQLAHDRGGGWQMAMFMLVDELERALDGKALAHPLQPPDDPDDDRHPEEAGPEQPG